MKYIRKFNESKSEGILVRDEKHLKELIRKSPLDADLNHLDVSKVTDMSHMFCNSKFNGDISKWKVHEVTNMSYMFSFSEFNGDISKWDVSKVTNMSFMFNRSQFNGDISGWDVSKVIDMYRMFYESKFNGDISGWNVSKFTNIKDMFYGSPLEGREPIWYKFLWEIKLFPDSKGLKDSIKQYKWLRGSHLEGWRILKKRLRDSIQAEWDLENDDPQIEEIFSRLPDHLENYIIEE